MDLFSQEIHNHLYVAGVDEAGRGPLAGDVFAAAVILDPNCPIDGLKDSKLLSAEQRNTLAIEIQNKAIAFSIASSSVQEIDDINILQATLLAMKRALLTLSVQPNSALIDGNQAPKGLPIPFETVIKGDRLHPCISAASILAKTARDASILALHQAYPMYGFNQHMGYGTVLHMDTLKQYGPCPAHRHSFKPVREALLLHSPED